MQSEEGGVAEAGFDARDMQALLDFVWMAAPRRRNLGRAMIEAQVQSTARGAILFDAALAAAPDPAWFQPDAAARRLRAGRGDVTFFDAAFGPCVLRHYRRGGLVARVNRDRYLWTGAARTRAFREFRLLAALHEFGLRVPAPVAARYRRDGLHYRADLVTRRIVGARTLAERLASAELDAAVGARVGRTLAGFHARGAWHADLNAHNILVDASGSIWLLDFDRGRLREPAMAWQQANLARLRRSFAKLGNGADPAEFDARFWHPLLAAYHRTLADRAARAETP